jgi:hypothetical protein
MSENRAESVSFLYLTRQHQILLGKRSCLNAIGIRRNRVATVENSNKADKMIIGFWNGLVVQSHQDQDI